MMELESGRNLMQLRSTRSKHVWRIFAIANLLALILWVLCVLLYAFDLFELYVFVLPRELSILLLAAGPILTVSILWLYWRIYRRFGVRQLVLEIVLSWVVTFAFFAGGYLGGTRELQLAQICSGASEAWGEATIKSECAQRSANAAERKRQLLHRKIDIAVANNDAAGLHEVFIGLVEVGNRESIPYLEKVFRIQGPESDCTWDHAWEALAQARKRDS